MRKKILIILLTIFLPLSLPGKQIDAGDVTFLVDIHDVFLQKDYPKVFSIIWQNAGTILSNPTMLKKLATLGWTHFTEQELTSGEFIQAAIDNDSPQFVEVIKAIANAQQPINDSIEILKELSDHGYTLHIGSNIGKEVFEELKNKEKHPELAPVFDLFDLQKSQISEHNQNDTVKKPEFRFYKNYLRKNDNKDPQTVFFIDDIKINVSAAKKLGFDAIHYQNPDQLRDELIKRGFTFLKKN